MSLNLLDKQSGLTANIPQTKRLNTAEQVIDVHISTVTREKGKRNINHIRIKPVSQSLR